MFPPRWLAQQREVVGDEQASQLELPLSWSRDLDGRIVARAGAVIVLSLGGLGFVVRFDIFILGSILLSWLIDIWFGFVALLVFWWGIEESPVPAPLWLLWTPDPFPQLLLNLMVGRLCLAYLFDCSTGRVGERHAILRVQHLLEDVVLFIFSGIELGNFFIQLLPLQV